MLKKPYMWLYDTLCIKIEYCLAVLWFGWPKLMLFVSRQKHLKPRLFQIDTFVVQSDC